MTSLYVDGEAGGGGRLDLGGGVPVVLLPSLEAFRGGEEILWWE